MSIDLAAVIGILAVCVFLIARSIKRKITAGMSSANACSCCGVRGECGKPDAAISNRP